MDSHQKAAVELALKEFGKVEVKVDGYSMWPFIKPKDVIQITSRPSFRKKYRVAVFWAESQLIAHRIVKKKASQSGKTVFEISADFVRKSKVLIPEEDIVGVVFGLKRGGRIIHFGLSSPTCYLVYFSSFLTKYLNFHKHSVKE